MLLLFAFQISVGNGVTFLPIPLCLFKTQFGRGEIGIGTDSLPLQNSKRRNFVTVSGSEKLCEQNGLQL
jgi:hypothetical protein